MASAGPTPGGGAGRIVSTPPSARRRGSLLPGPTPVPDFSALHISWERRLASAKAARRQHATVPQVRFWGEWDALPIIDWWHHVSHIWAVTLCARHLSRQGRPCVPAVLMRSQTELLPLQNNPPTAAAIHLPQSQAFNVYHDSPEELATRRARTAALAGCGAPGGSPSTQAALEPRCLPTAPKRRQHAEAAPPGLLPPSKQGHSKDCGAVGASGAAGAAAAPLLPRTVVGGTLSARLKAEATRRGMEEGRFDSREAR
jgi:hypothetical protein